LYPTDSRHTTLLRTQSGIIASIVGVVVVAAELYGLASAHQPINPALWFIGSLNLLLLAIWIFFITPSWVIRAGNLYADRLMEGLDSL
jgi:ABC-type amino acid transport system permease subunit